LIVIELRFCLTEQLGGDIVLDRVDLSAIEYTVPHHSTARRISRFGLATTANAIGRIRNRAEPREWDRFATTLAIAVDTTFDTTDGFVDRVKLATFRLDQLAVQFVLNGVSRSVEHVTSSLLVQLAQKAEVAFEGTMKRIAPSNELFTKLFDCFFSGHRITS
jgi:hypothetical protein